MRTVSRCNTDRYARPVAPDFLVLHADRDFLLDSGIEERYQTMPNLLRDLRRRRCRPSSMRTCIEGISRAQLSRISRDLPGDFGYIEGYVSLTSYYQEDRRRTA
jgi:hypothetical protein